jgi:lysophospholipid acyltransferase (LPLAT)-like uncharacterized protein
VSRLSDRFVEAAAPRLVYAYVRLLWASMRVEYRNREVLDRAREEHGQYILAFWHSRLLLMPFVYPDDKVAVLSSTHRDSEMLGRVLARFGVTRALGSSTRGSVSGMRQLLRLVRDGYDLALTPDGPKGPRRRVKPGVIATAAHSGKPVIPVAFAASRGRRVGSWDRTLLPYPFSRGVYLYGEPLLVPRKASKDQAERLRKQLEESIDALTDEADRAMGFPLEDARPEPAS